MSGGNPPRYLEAKSCKAASMAASAKLRRSIKLGSVADKRGQFCCDCGKAAKVHDHRDYALWWDGAPVCVGCNALRGRAAPFQDLPRYWWLEKKPNPHAECLNQFADSLLRLNDEELDAAITTEPAE